MRLRWLFVGGGLNANDARQMFCRASFASGSSSNNACARAIVRKTDNTKSYPPNDFKN